MNRQSTRALVLALAGALALPVAAQNANANDRAHENREARDARESNADQGRPSDTDGNGRPTSTGSGQPAAAQDRAGSQGPARANGWTYGVVISSLRNGTARDIAAALRDPGQVGLLPLSRLGPAGENAAALHNALDSGGQSVAEVQAAIATNPALAAAVAATGYRPQDIIGFTYDLTGQVILIVDDLD